MKVSSSAPYVAMVCLGAVAFFLLGDFLAKEKLQQSVGAVVYLKTKVAAGEVFRPEDLEQLMVLQEDIPGKAISSTAEAAGKTALYDSYPEILTSYLVGFPGKNKRLEITVESLGDRGYLDEFERRAPALVFNDWLLERLQYERGPRGEVNGDYYFFPYRNCLLITVRNVRKHNSQVLIEADEIDVLRGNLSRGATTFSLKEMEGSEKFAELEKLHGKTCLVAFNELWRQSYKDPLPVYCFSVKQIGKLSARDLQIWKRNLSKSLFPYQYCSLVTIQRPEPIVRAIPAFGEGGPVDVSIRIDEMFIQDECDAAAKLCTGRINNHGENQDFKVGNIIKCKISGDLAGCFQSNFNPSLIGSRAIWAFNAAGKSRDKYDFVDLHSPFPGQDFNEHDIARLRKWLAPTQWQIKTLRDELQGRMHEFWTEDRIKQFCRPVNLRKSGDQELVRGSKYEPVLSGHLYANRPELGKVTWHTKLLHGEPDAYELDVVRGKLTWRVISRCPDLLRGDDANFVRQLLNIK